MIPAIVPNFAETLQSDFSNQVCGESFIPIKEVTIINGEPVIRWTNGNVSQIDVIEKLNYAIIGKFSHGWPSLEELQRIIPL